MKIAYSNTKPKLIEYIGSGNWRVRWDIENTNLQSLYKYKEHEFNHCPLITDIKKIIIQDYNLQIDNKIKSEFIWNNIPIWLSTENLFNYKAAYDLAYLTNGKNLPITFKFGTDLKPIYYTFNDIEELSDFYIKAVTYINNTLSLGWKQKESIDWEQYKNGELSN